MKNLYFIRHGQSEANVAAICGGRIDSPLTNAGRAQAKAAGVAAKTGNLQFDVVISSPLSRALSTAQILCAEIGYDVDKIETRDLLIERSFGDAEGKDLETETGISLEFYYKNPQSIDHVNNVETMQQLHERAQQVIDFAKARPEQTVLLVSHGALARSIMKVLKGIPYDQPIEAFDNAVIVKLI